MFEPSDLIQAWGFDMIGDVEACKYHFRLQQKLSCSSSCSSCLVQEQLILFQNFLHYFLAIRMWDELYLKFRILGWRNYKRLKQVTYQMDSLNISFHEIYVRVFVRSYLKLERLACIFLHKEPSKELVFWGQIHLSNLHKCFSNRSILFCYGQHPVQKILLGFLMWSLVYASIFSMVEINCCKISPPLTLSPTPLPSLRTLEFFLANALIALISAKDLSRMSSL